MAFIYGGKVKGNIRGKSKDGRRHKSHYEVCVDVKRMTESNIELDRQ